MNKKIEVFMKEVLLNDKIKVGSFEFPPKQEMNLKLKDLLEENVDEKYYISQKRV